MDRDDENYDDHRNSVHHKSNLEEICDLDADVAKSQLPLVASPQAARRQGSLCKSPVSASRLPGAIKLLTDKVHRLAIHWHIETHVALFPTNNIDNCFICFI